MANRTLAMMVANVQRKVGSGAAIPRLDIIQAINTAHMEIHGAYDWPWTYKETNIFLNPSYSTGTVSVNIASNVVTGVGTAWSASWTNRRIRLDNNQDWPILSVQNAGLLTLVQGYHGTANLSAASYVIYQDVFTMPSDFEPGKDLVILQPDVRIRVRHIPRLALESQGVVLKSLFTNIAMGYSDQGRDSSGNHLIRLIPPPTSTNTLRLVYKARPTDFAALTDTSWLPQTYQDILELMAESEVKRTHGISGFDVPAAIAARKRMQMKRQIVATTGDIRAEAFGGSGLADSSISWRGLSILPWGS
jgi:hypothetical protein